MTAQELRAIRAALRTVQSWEYGERHIPEPIARLVDTLVRADQSRRQ